MNDIPLNVPSPKKRSRTPSRSRSPSPVMNDGFLVAPQPKRQLLQPLHGNKYKASQPHYLPKTNHILIGGDIRNDGTIGEFRASTH